MGHFQVREKKELFRLPTGSTTLGVVHAFILACNSSTRVSILPWERPLCSLWVPQVLGLVSDDGRLAVKYRQPQAEILDRSAQHTTAAHNKFRYNKLCQQIKSRPFFLAAAQLLPSPTKLRLFPYLHSKGNGQYIHLGQNIGQLHIKPGFKCMRAPLYPRFCMLITPSYLTCTCVLNIFIIEVNLQKLNRQPMSTLSRIISFY